MLVRPLARVIMQAIMKHLAVAVSIILFAVVIFGALRAVLQRRLLFLLALDEKTQRAYTCLAILAGGLLAYALLDLKVESVEIAGVKATVGTLEKRVDQIEAFFERKKIEVFDRSNWHDRVSVVTNKPGAIVLRVTLEQEPIPGSIEVFEGV
jgi:hypothetical protein